MKTYLVGGAVRDALMGATVKDRDWVVVGAHAQTLMDQGFLPVGRDFPVFLHPHTREEYALARTERKTGQGYHGFAFHADPTVTLEQDLSRRDLTINAMAQAPDGSLFDPFHGQRDIQQRVLRHVSDAFGEDPVRILRVARFAARFPDFSVAQSTMTLMQSMVAQGQVQHLVAERVWQELSKGLMEQEPSRMFEVLREAGALKALLPELDALWGVPQRAQYHPEIDTGVHVMMVLNMAAGLKAPLAVRFACMVHDLGKGTTPADVLPRHLGHEGRSVGLLRQVCDRWRVPSDCRELAIVVAQEHGNIHRCEALNPASLLRLLTRCDALRRPERFAHVLQACECDARGRLGFDDAPYPQAQHLQSVLAAALQIDAGAAAEQALAKGLKASKIGEFVSQARIKAILNLLSRQSP